MVMFLNGMGFFFLINIEWHGVLKKRKIRDEKPTVFSYLLGTNELLFMNPLHSCAI